MIFPVLPLPQRQRRVLACEYPIILFTPWMLECFQCSMDVGLAALGPGLAISNFIDGSSQCLRITPSYHGSRSWKRAVGSSSLSPCQCSALRYVSSERRSSSLDIWFSLDTSAKVCRFQSKNKSYFFSYIFKYFGNFLPECPLFLFPVLPRCLFKQFCMHL